ncbi:MAG TPA: helix-turn-helix domain-containing protein [Acidimicrobiales bacterium]|nr:helix-turn-helix domain-containing protein [Acidimicrobiales bacterium]
MPRSEIVSHSTLDLSRPVEVRYSDGSVARLSDDQARRVEAALGQPVLLSPRDAARILGVSRPMIYRWISDGLLEDQKVGAHHKVTADSVFQLKDVRSKAGRAALSVLRDADSDPVAAARLAAARGRAAEAIARRDRGLA